MKSKIPKSIQLSVIAASMLASCLALSNAYASDVELGWWHPDYNDQRPQNGSWRVYPFDGNPPLPGPTPIERANSLYKKYGNIGYVRNAQTGDRIRNYYRILHGALDQPKWGAYTIGIIPQDENGKDLEQKELIFDSQKAASDLCEDLGRGMDGYILNGRVGSYSWKSVIANGYYPRVIMVPYTIDYDTGSQQNSDGTSTKAKKYVMCPNYGGAKEWKLDPRNNNENEETGIVSGKLNADKTEYTVTCMPAVAVTKPPITLTRQFTSNGVVTWSDGTHPGTFFVNEANLTNLHQFNKYLGAQYCPVSPE